jgi:octaprenyl-diphosphate synthase
LKSAVAPLTARLNDALRRTLDEDGGFFGEVSVYSLLAGGKRLRPLIFCLAHQALGGAIDEEILKLASTFEFLHMATLMHDDIIDQADTRRGRPSAHRIFGIPEAVMTADYLLAKAASLSLVRRNFESMVILVDVLRDLSLGELAELRARGDVELSKTAYLEIVRQKTAVLIEAVGRTAAVLAGAGPEPTRALTDYGRLVGLAFQIADDLLDYQASEDKLGKPAGQDLAEGRVTLPFIAARERLDPAGRERLLELGAKIVRGAADWTEVLALVERGGGLAAAQHEADDLAEQAAEALGPLPPSDAKALLAEVARYAVRRSS